MRKNWFTTVGGIMAGFSLIPFAIGTLSNQLNLHLTMPAWIYIVCVFLGTLGPVIIGLGAKGQDEHSTMAEVNESTQADKAAQK